MSGWRSDTNIWPIVFIGLLCFFLFFSECNGPGGNLGGFLAIVLAIVGAVLFEKFRNKRLDKEIEDNYQHAENIRNILREELLSLRCSKCDSGNPDEAKFCMSCGQDL